MQELILLILRWFHFLFGITWIGLLYYFNFVQTPFFAETEPGVRSGAVQKLVPRALWYFRWSAMGTVIVGWTYLIIQWVDMGSSFLAVSYGVSILTGGIIGTIMFLNVWLVIWPKQKIVIANAVATAGGAAANPAAAPAGRRAGLASRTNTLLSIPMLWFMASAKHYTYFAEPSSTGYLVWIIIGGGLVLLVELNALLGTQGATKKPLDSIAGTIHAGLGLTLVLGLIMGFAF